MNLLRRLSLHLIRSLPPSEMIGYDDDAVISMVQRSTEAAKLTPLPYLESEQSVLDFGGGFGIHYRRATLSHPSIKWAVVEIPAIVDRARETDNLRFFCSIRDALDWLGTPDTFHSDGALQYTKEPERYLQEACLIRAQKMIWLRTMLATNRACSTQVKLLAENGPRTVIDRRRVSASIIKMSEQQFISAHVDYRLVERKDSFGEGKSFVFRQRPITQDSLR